MKRWFMLAGLPAAVVLGAATAGHTYLRLIWRRSSGIATNAEEI